MKYPKHHDNKPSVLRAKNIINAILVSQNFRHAALFIGTLPTNQILTPALKQLNYEIDQ